MIKKLLPWMLALTLGVLFWTWRSTTLTTPLQISSEAMSPPSTVEESEAPATATVSDVPA